MWLKQLILSLKRRNKYMKFFQRHTTNKKLFNRIEYVRIHESKFPAMKPTQTTLQRSLNEATTVLN